MKDILKNKDGITLIALVITIIVLLILAGVTISMVLGDNGIIAQAQHANKAYSDSEKSENDKIDETDLMIDYYGNTSNSGWVIPKSAYVKTTENEDTSGKTEDFIVYNNQIVGTGRNKFTGKIMIPSSINGTNITGICAGTLGFNPSETIENDKKKIEEVTEIYMQSGIEEISNSAFANNPMKKIILPDTLKKIDGGAFCDSGIRNLVIPSSVISIGQNIILVPDSKEKLTITFEGNTPPTFEGENYGPVFADIDDFSNKLIEIRVPNSAIEQYKTALNRVYYDYNNTNPYANVIVGY